MFINKDVCSRIFLQSILALMGFALSAGHQGLAASVTPTPVATGFPEAKTGGTFTTRLSTYPRTLNRFRAASDLYTGAVAENVIESLTSTDFETWDDVPSVAKNWNLSDDKLKVVFQMDERARWSDGTPVTAADVVFTWDTLFNEKLDTSSSRSYHEALKSWKKVDNLTVEFEFKRVDFQNVSRVGGEGIMQKSVYSKGKFDDDFNNLIVGSGPYMFDAKNSKKGRKVTLVRNKKWWARDLPRAKGMYNFDKVIYNVIEDDRVAFEAFKKGEASWYEFTAAGLEIWSKEVVGKPLAANHQTLTWPMANPSQWGGIALNMRRAPTDDLRFRQALQKLFNYQLYCDKIFDGLQAPLLGPFGNYGEYGSPNRKVVAFDPDGAKKLLSEMGYTKADSDGVLYKEAGGAKQRAEITIMFAYQPHEKYLTIFKEDAKKVGLSVNLKFTEWAAASKLVDERKFDGFTMGWGGNPTPDPSQLWMSKFADENASSNIPGFKSPEADKLIEESPAIFDKEKRLASYHKLEDIIVAAQPYLWRWQQKNHYFVYNKDMLAVPSKIYKYSGSSLRGQPWIFWWHAKPTSSH